MTDLLTYSRLSCFRACPRRHQLRYELGLVPEEESVALRIGTAFHAIKEAMDHGIDPDTIAADLDIYSRSMVAAMAQVHSEVWQQSHLEVVATEQAFDLPLLNPDTGKPTPLFRLAGVIDRIYRTPDGHLALQDYKTTTENISAGSDYWLRLSLDQQMAIYVYAARQLGYDVRTILYDVTVRPLHRPLMRTPEDKVRLKKDGTPYADTRFRDEMPEQFAARVAEAMRSDPDRYFARREIAKLDDDIDDTLAEIWHQQQVIREMQRTGRWYRNPGACVAPYRCAYLPICDARNLSAAPPGYRITEDKHPEITRHMTPPSGG